MTGSAGDGQVALGWVSIPGATRYQVERATSSSGPWSILATGTTSLAYTDTTAVNGTAYYYRVRAETALVNGSYSSVAGPYTPTADAEEPPGVPRNPDATDDGENAVDFDWDAPSSWGTGSNRIYRYQLWQGAILVTSGTTISSSHRFTGLTADTIYNALVRAETEDGESAYVGEFVVTDAGSLAWGAWSGSWAAVTSGFEISTDVDGADEATNTLKRYASTTANVWSGGSSGMFGVYPVGGTTVQTFQQIPSSGNIHRINNAYVNFSESYINPLGSGLNNYRGSNGEVWGINRLTVGSNQPSTSGIPGTVRAVAFIRWQQDSGQTSGTQQAYYVTSSGVYRKTRRYE